MIHNYISKFDSESDEVERQIATAMEMRIDQERASKFLAALSRLLISKEIARLYPELISLGFFLRPTEIASLSKTFCDGSDGVLSSPKGLVFHVPPANVDTIFVYSWALSLLAGNSNIVRISERSGPAAILVLDKIAELLRTEFQDLVHSQLFIGIPRGSRLLSHISGLCDLRVLWGGDQAINEIRKFPLDAKATDITFPDRSSFTCINSREVIRLDQSELKLLAEKFSNDVWWFDQAACSSPKVIFWIGETEDSEKARRLFLSTVSDFLTKQDIGGNSSLSMERFVKLSKIAMTYESRLDFSFNRLALVETSFPTHEWQGTGSFIEIHLQNLEALSDHVQKRDQTLTYFGFSREQLLNLAKSLRGRGIDRLVPIGDALSFSAIWDGYDLCSVFSRKMTF